MILCFEITSYAAAAGVAPQLYLEQPTGNIKYAYHRCDNKLNTWLDDGTPVICTEGNVFYVMGSIGGDTLAQRVNAVAKAGTQFITVRLAAVHAMNTSSCCHTVVARRAAVLSQCWCCLVHRCH